MSTCVRFWFSVATALHAHTSSVFFLYFAMNVYCSADVALIKFHVHWLPIKSAVDVGIHNTCIHLISSIELHRMFPTNAATAAAIHDFAG
jgi:hypothetical protein